MRQRRAGSRIDRGAGTPVFSALGFVLFHLIPNGELGAPSYTVVRLRETRTARAALASLA
jgi:hypothetical protein